MSQSFTITLSRAFQSNVKPTANVKQCAAAFGIGIDSSIEIVLYRDLQLTIDAGTVIYVTGESGAGKSCLLRDIKDACADQAAIIELPSVSSLDDVPLVDQFGDMPLDDVLKILSAVGIAEPFVFLRRPKELSDGQRYRFLLANAVVRAKSMPDDRVRMVFVDEALAFLDRETARNVAYQVRRLATRERMTFVFASTHTDIIEDLQADVTAIMRLNMPVELRSGVTSEHE